MVSPQQAAGNSTLKLIQWWRRQDLNLRTRERTDLQSVAMMLSDIIPTYTKVYSYI